jgi:hypothetical protein
MTNEQINAAIAKLVGWINRGLNYNYPDYCNDLNAMHEAEKVIEISYYREYTNLLYDIALKVNKETNIWMPYSSTARQRAEAFLRTIGRWEE